MNGYEITILVLLAVGLIAETALHGQERTGKHNVLLKMISTGITFWLFYKAGLFQIF